MIRVLLADDHSLMREGLRSLFDGRDDMAVIADAANGRTAVALALKHKPEVIIMDVSMPDLNGIEATTQILKKLPGAKIIALSIHRDPRFVAGMYKAGAMGYVLKDNVFKELLRAVKMVVAGQRYICPDLTDVVVASLANPAGSTATPLGNLTPRERQTLQLLAEGNTMKRISQHLGVSVKTIETYRQSIGHKLGVHSMVQLIKLAVREGIVSLEP
ncbi:MAG: response regulator transcription factor [bacterium]|nr:response regulator transcription factor [bacterium]